MRRIAVLTIYYQTGCKGRIKKYKSEAFEGCIENRGLVFSSTARALSWHVSRHEIRDPFGLTKIASEHLGLFQLEVLSIATDTSASRMSSRLVEVLSTVKGPLDNRGAIFDLGSCQQLADGAKENFLVASLLSYQPLHLWLGSWFLNSLQVYVPQNIRKIYVLHKISRKRF